jgi:transposase
MIEHTADGWVLSGPDGKLLIPHEDDVTPKLAMLFEVRCEGQSVGAAAKKFGYSRQRYYQLLHRFEQHGAMALGNQKRGPKTPYRRTDENVRQVIRHRFLDPAASPEVIGQKMRQTGRTISTRSVERVIHEFGLQKKTLSIRAAGPGSSTGEGGRGAGASVQNSNADAQSRRRDPRT